MDIQVSSNFERQLFDLYDRDGAAIARLDGRFPGAAAPRSAGRGARPRCASCSTPCGSRKTRSLRPWPRCWRTCGQLIDPHTAVGVHAGRRRRLDPAVPLITLATAHPAKFPDAVRHATGVTPPLPARLADLVRRRERFEVLPNDLAAVQRHIERAVKESA